MSDIGGEGVVLLSAAAVAVPVPVPVSSPVVVSAGSGAPLAAVVESVARCVGLAGCADVGSRLELIRGLEELAVRVQVAQARVLAGLEVHEAADLGPAAVLGPVGVPLSVPGPDAVTPHEVAGFLECSVESVRTRLAVAVTVVADLPGVAAAAEAGALRWWQVRRTVDAVWHLPPEVVPALDERVAELARQGRLRVRFASTLGRVVLALDPELAERCLAQALVERGVRVRPDEQSPGIGVLVASLPAEGAITVAACLDRLADTALSTPPLGMAVEGRSAANRRADALVGLAACVLDAFHAADTDHPDDSDDTAADDTDTADIEPADGGNADGVPAVSQRAVAAGPDADPETTVDTVTAADPVAAADPVVAVDRRVAAATAAAVAAVGAMVAAVGARLAGARAGTGAGNGGVARVLPRPVRRGRRSGEVRVTVSAETLLGVRDHPGDIAGWGPITAAHARRLAARDGVAWRRILTDPTSGAVLEVGRARYAPSAAMTDLVLARDDGRCTRPGCAHCARDLDHATAFSAGGTTGVGNLHAVCRGRVSSSV